MVQTEEEMNDNKRGGVFRQLSSPLDTVTEDEVSKQLGDMPHVRVQEKKTRLLHRSSSLTEVGKSRTPTRGGDRLSTKSEGGRRRRVSVPNNTFSGTLTWHNVSCCT